MATDRYSVCNAKRRIHRVWIPRLFDALLDVAEGRARCSECGSGSYVELAFAFGNGRYPHACRVGDAFLPDPRPRSWQEGGQRRYFYPFLVMVESSRDGRRSAWFPYWHVDTNRRGKVV